MIIHLFLGDGTWTPVHSYEEIIKDKKSYFVFKLDYKIETVRRIIKAFDISKEDDISKEENFDRNTNLFKIELPEFDKEGNKCLLLIWSRVEQYQEHTFNFLFFGDITGSMNTPIGTWKAEKKQEIKTIQKRNKSRRKELLIGNMQLDSNYLDMAKNAKGDTMLLQERLKSRRGDNEHEDDGEEVDDDTKD